MLVDDRVTTQESGTETAPEETTDSGARTSEDTTPSIDWEAARKHPEFKAHVKTYLESDEEFKKEASRGVRMTDVERRAEERATATANMPLSRRGKASP